MDAFLFPGQGSQRRGMGQELFDAVPEFRNNESEINAILGYSLRDLCVDDKENKLRETQYTQPALYAVNFLHYCKSVRDGKKADYVAGHSLGEFNALTAAGAFDFLTGLRIVKIRGELMARARNGAMAAVIGPPASFVESVLQRHGLQAIDVANYNSPKQTVISGPQDEIKQAEAAFKLPEVQLFIQLPVSAAFHSRYMGEAAKEFGRALAEFEIGELKLPVAANVTGSVYPSQSGGEAVRSMLVKQIESPVRWEATIQDLRARGVTTFVEVGPGNVLTKLVDQIPPKAHLN